jgi:histidine triad (HIT) family protein
MLNEEQVQKIKNQLLKQLENFPEDKREEIKNKILSMTNEEIEQFVKENNLDYSNNPEEQKQKCIFCAIAEGKIKSYKIDENENYLAILELNPLSKGHTLIIPKKHTELKDIEENALEFAKKVSENLVKKLKPKEIKLSKNEIMTHAILEIIPIFGDEKEKKTATEEELQSLQNELTQKQDKPKIEEPKEKAPEIPIAKPEEKIEPPKKPELPKIPLRLKWI